MITTLFDLTQKPVVAGSLRRDHSIEPVPARERCVPTPRPVPPFSGLAAPGSRQDDAAISDSPPQDDSFHCSRRQRRRTWIESSCGGAGILSLAAGVVGDHGQDKSAPGVITYI